LTEPTADPPLPPAPSLTDQLQALWRELPGLVSDRVELFSLELQRAAQALARIVALLVAVAVLGVTVWLVLWAVLIQLLVLAGLPLAAALVLAIAVNGLAIVLALHHVRRLLPQLKLPATRRHLMIDPQGPTGEGADETR
jgi:uncharacterized membrane protein YqjE